MRRLNQALFISVLPIAIACGGAGPSASRIALAEPQPSAVQTPSASSNAQPAEPALVVEGSIDVSVGEITGALSAIREELKKSGGRIVSERESGAGLSWSATVVARVQPKALDSLLAAVTELGTTTNKRIDAEDVGKTLFDQDIALANLNTTLERMRGVLATPGLKVAEVLEIEREMTRLRGEIERIKGSQRFLRDRVSFATLTINLRRDGGVILSPSAKIYPGPRLASLVLLRPGARQRVRFGGGATLLAPVGRLSLDVDVFAAGDGEDDPALMITGGAAMYSDFLGRGRRRFLNPYLGFRAGYAYLEGSRLTAALDVGLELFKTSRFMIEANVRGAAFIGEESDFGLVFATSGVVAF